MERTLHHRLGRRAALLSAALLSGLVVGVFPAQAAPAAADAANASAVAAVPGHAPAVGWRILTAVGGDVTPQGWTWIR